MSEKTKKKPGDGEKSGTVLQGRYEVSGSGRGIHFGRDTLLDKNRSLELRMPTRSGICRWNRVELRTVSRIIWSLRENSARFGGTNISYKYWMSLRRKVQSAL